MSSLKSIIDDDFCGERISFLQLVKEYTILLPVIQRDYAQGRKEKRIEEIRQNFVENLISYIKDSSKASHDLDFIYGTVDVENKEFVPLDGQQRLTTLFLLHLYVAGRSGHFGDFESIMEGRFLYKTRSSSTMFCKKLVSSYDVSDLRIENNNKQTFIRKTNIFEELKRKEETSEGTRILLSETIKNQGWFFKSWLQDPTIYGMLVMLDEIDKKFRDDPDQDLCQKAYDRIFNCPQNENQPITFQKLSLNGYSRTDDLYIKMNARGIHLTDFENFKARIEDLIDNNGFDFKEAFINKVDIDWSEYLWKFHGKEDNTDRIMENLFRNFIAFSYRLDSDADKTTIKDRMNYLLEQNDKTIRFTFTQYCELGVFHKRNNKVDSKQIESEEKTLRKIIDFFDIFCDAKITPVNNTNEWFDPSQFIHGCFISKDASFSNRLRLYAYLQYRRKHKIVDEADLLEWMRLIRNLDNATDIDDAEGFYRAICSVDDLLEKIDNKTVQGWLASDARNSSVTFFRARQTKEECIKAQLRKAEKKYGLTNIYDIIIECDKNDYIEGQMGFILEYSGCYDLYENDSIQSMNQEQIEDCSKKIGDYAQKSICVFNSLLSDKSNRIITECLLERALLTFGMYMRGNGDYLYNFCNKPYDQYNSWKTLLFMEENTRTSRNCFKCLLDTISVGTLESDLDSIIKNYSRDIPLWRQKFIDDYNLIKYCHQGFVYFYDMNQLDDDEPNIILLSQKQMNSHHSEFESIFLYNKLNSKYPIKYTDATKSDDDTTVDLRFSDGTTEYIFEIYHWDKTWNYAIIDMDNNDITKEMPIVVRNMKEGMKGESILELAYENISNSPNYNIITE